MNKLRIRPSTPVDAHQTALMCAAAALEKKAFALTLLNVKDLAGYADYFLFGSGSSTRQVTAIAEKIHTTMKKAGLRPLGVSGIREGSWALIDLGDVIVHIFHDPVREFYDLEAFWGDAPIENIDSEQLTGLLPRKRKLRELPDEE